MNESISAISHRNGTEGSMANLRRELGIPEKMHSQMMNRLPPTGLRACLWGIGLTDG